MMRNKNFLMATAVSLLLIFYVAAVGFRAALLLASDSPLGQGLGAAILLFPLLGIWFMVHEWRLSATVQRMADTLDAQGRLPLHDGETLPSGRLTPEAAESVFAVAKMGVDEHPDDWVAWFHVAYAYEANRDRKMARSALRHAAHLFKNERAAAK